MLKKMQESFMKMKNIKENNIIDYKAFMAVIDKYEELNMSTYVNNDKSKLVINDPNNTQIKTGMDSLVTGLKNPFMHLYTWCKGELYDLEALLEAVQVRDGIGSQRGKMESKKKSTQSDLENMQVGKKTIRTAFKKDSDAGGMSN